MYLTDCNNCIHIQYYEVNTKKVFVCRKLHLVKAETPIKRLQYKQKIDCSCDSYKFGKGFRRKLNGHITMKSFRATAPVELVMKLTTTVAREKMR